MAGVKSEIGNILDKISDELNISNTMQKKAVSTYTSVGTWLEEGLDFKVEIMPQGSMNLGTVVRPIGDMDDGYDMDLVCLLKDGINLESKEIKTLVGDRLKEHEGYKAKLEEEGRRCWTMNFDGFHMDILPSVPEDSNFIKHVNTAIRLTHKNDSGTYEKRFSNPFEYFKWFESRMEKILRMKKQEYADRENKSIDEVPTYKIRTPLQKVIQLLKRHRDIFFLNDDEDAPISIIITTLATLAYNGESDLYEALSNIVKHMPDFIERSSGEYYIKNPVMPKENFADKWNQKSSKINAFNVWIEKVNYDLLLAPLQSYGIDELAQKFSPILGDKPTKRAIEKVGEDSRVLRSEGSLYIENKSGILLKSTEKNVKKVKEHTFFGK